MYECKECDFSVKNKTKYTVHCSSKKHLKNCSVKEEKVIVIEESLIETLTKHNALLQEQMKLLLKKEDELDENVCNPVHIIKFLNKMKELPSLDCFDNIKVDYPERFESDGDNNLVKIFQQFYSENKETLPFRIVNNQCFGYKCHCILGDDYKPCKKDVCKNWYKIDICDKTPNHFINTFIKHVFIKVVKKYQEKFNIEINPFLEIYISIISYFPVNYESKNKLLLSSIK